MTFDTAILAALLGGVAGLSLGLIGAGSSILVVPLLVYAMHLPPHQAIGTDTVAVTMSALWSLIGHARAGTVRWPSAGAFTLASITGAASGAHLGKIIDGHVLLAALGIVMMMVAVLMLRPRSLGHEREIPLNRSTARRQLPPLLAVGFGVGTLAGFVGVGGGFLTIPALVFITGMPLLNAVGSSLVSVTAVAATTATSYASSNLVEWSVAGFLVLGGVLGGYLGVKLAGILAGRKRVLNFVFSAVVALAGLFVTIRGVASLI